jgi:hypothetical protein
MSKLKDSFDKSWGETKQMKSLGKLGAFIPKYCDALVLKKYSEHLPSLN